ncbi:MAG TPA: glycine/sarcosine/betaine reductase selenoprotein B family protein [Burkholderiaceae bacterium]|nr:glycine/sarcosine/betaine reductase selenoprotein B family protein [Burkholderiaceae bacterium]
MVRLADLPPDERQHLIAKNMEPLRPSVFVSATIPLAQRRVALITTAGLHFRDEPSFELMDPSYRVIPGDLRGDELVMSHSSVNFDRSGFQEDLNVVFPIDRFRELVDEGVIGSLASQHFSFMGSLVTPALVEASARQVAGALRRDGVDTAFLTPV